MLNKFLVGANGRGIVIGIPPRQLSYDEALELAAHLVALAEPFAGKKFAEVLNEVTQA